MENSEVKNKHKNKGWYTQDYFIHLVFQSQEVTIWDIHGIQSHTLYTWRNETMGSQLMGKL